MSTTTADVALPFWKGWDWKRLGAMFLGIGLFSFVYFCPPWPDAVDPAGNTYQLSDQGKGALAIFCLAGVWWVFEVVPIGVTSIMIGLLQTLFLIRSDDPSQCARAAFHDFMDPSVMFIFASIIIGMVFTKVGLSRRLTYKMLQVVGERTSMILLGTFVVTALLTHVMAHTAVAATMFPILLAIHALYDEKEGKTQFGKALFMGMAYVAGAGSIVTLLGAARGAVALSFYKEITGQDISFFGLTYYMLPIGWIMVILLWFFFMIFFKPERDRIPGLRDRVKVLNDQLGGISYKEILTAAIVVGMILVLSFRKAFPIPPHKTAVILGTTVLFFIFRILDVKDLEGVPWNIILLFGGAMSIGYCLWETKAAEWMAIQCLALVKDAGPFLFVMGLSVFVLLMTNFIMNVAAISICLPVALRMAPELGVASDVIVFSALVVAGMPFLLLVGAAPNAIAYESKQFTSGQFFNWGLLASVILMAVMGLTIAVIWPMMGMTLTP